MADIEKSHHSQDLARVRTKSFKTLLDDRSENPEKGIFYDGQIFDITICDRKNAIKFGGFKKK